MIEPVTTKNAPNITVKVNGSGISTVTGDIWTKTRVMRGVVASIALTRDASIWVSASEKLP